MGEALVTGSFADVQRTTGAGLVKSWLKVEALLLVDVSGSMESRDAGEGGRERRVDVARREVAKLQKKLPGKLAIVPFHSDAAWAPEGRLPEPGGSTDLAGALEYVRDLLGESLEGLKLIVVSDGSPDSQEDAIAQAVVVKGAGATISTVYVGPDHQAGPEFLKRLAQAAGGSSEEAKLVKELEGAVTKLLGDGAGAS